MLAVDNVDGKLALNPHWFIRTRIGYDGNGQQTEHRCLGDGLSKRVE